MAGRPRMFDELISKARALGASDVHLEAETPIVARIRGELQIVETLAFRTLAGVVEFSLQASKAVLQLVAFSAGLFELGRAYSRGGPRTRGAVRCGDR